MIKLNQLNPFLEKHRSGDYTIRFVGLDPLIDRLLQPFKRYAKLK